MFKSFNLVGKTSIAFAETIIELFGILATVFNNVYTHLQCSNNDANDSDTDACIVVWKDVLT